MLQAGLIDAFEQIPLHLEFNEDCPLLIQYAFSSVFGVSLGIVIAYIVAELIRYIDE